MMAVLRCLVAEAKEQFASTEASKALTNSLDVLLLSKKMMYSINTELHASVIGPSPYNPNSSSDLLRSC